MMRLILKFSAKDTTLKGIAQIERQRLQLKEI